MSERRIKGNPTWREQRVSAGAKSLKEISFSDTFPNYYYVNNQSGGDLFLSVKGIPDKNNYDLFIEAGGTNIFARGLGSNRIMVYNDSASPSSFNIITFEEEFSPSALGSSTTLNVQGSTGYDGVIRGFTAPLPVGNNKIGGVDITSPLPSGGNQIGRVEMSNILQFIDSLNKSDIMGKLEQINAKTYGVVSSHYYQESTVTTNEIVLTLDKARQINFITNDGSTDLMVSFSTSPIVAGTFGGDGVITLKANESLQHLNRYVSSIRVKRVSGSGIVRILGV